MTLNVHYHVDPATKPLEILQANLNSGISFSAGEEIPPEPDFRVLICGRPSRELLTTSPRLETLIIPYAGIPESTRRLLSDLPQIEVYNLHHNAAPTAEMAVALLLAAAKFLVPIDRDFRQHNWTPRYQANPSLLLEGKTATILGFGHIGQRVALVCKALGMNVIGVRRNINAPLIPGVLAEVHGVQELEQILTRTDALILTLPLTAETEGMIGLEQLAHMRPGGILVNVGRGPVVDQDALFQALTDGTLTAAGLDVWYNYPETADDRISTPPADYPFHQLDNVVMSPHRAGGSRDIEVKRMQHLSQLLNEIQSGSPTQNRVDLNAGY